MNRFGTIGRGFGRLGPAVVFLVWLTGTAHGQLRLQVQIGQAGGPGRLGAGGAAATADTAIGDPWWDQAEGGHPTANGEAPPPPAATRRDPQARLEGVRRSRGLQLLRRELSLVQAACPTLEPAQRQRILAVGREAVEAQAAGRTPLVNGLEAAVEHALRTEAGDEAAVAYRGERDARLVRRQAAVIAWLVDAIDRDAVLDAAGRAALAESLRVRWRPEWELVGANAARQPFGGVPLPVGVADAAAAALDDEAFEAWRRRSREARR